MPQKSAGCLTEPPVSLPRLSIQSAACTATAEPPEDPPGTLLLSLAFNTGPLLEFSLEDPMANSSQFNLPMMMAPSASNRSTAVALYSELNPLRIEEEAETE